MRVLMVCVDSPWPPTAGASQRSWEWLRAASRGAIPGVVAAVRSARGGTHAAEMLGRVSRFVLTVPAPRTTVRRARDLVRSTVRGIPYLVAAGREPALLDAVRQAVREFRPDVVQAEQIGAAFALDIARVAGIRALYSAHNLEARLLEGPSPSRLSAWRRWRASRMRREECRVVRLADAVVAVSEAEASWFAAQGARTHVVPNGVDVSAHVYTPPDRRRHGAIVFVGHLAYPPNVDAARTLVRAVLPLVRARHPGVRCLLAGLHPVRAVRRLAFEGDDVNLLASPLDAREAWDRARMLVCPLRWGAGSRIKLLEAAARGVPIVATPTSAEGLALRADVDYLAADSPAELAEAASALLAEPRRAQRIAEEARATVRRHHDWGCYAPRLERLYAASGSWS